MTSPSFNILKKNLKKDFKKFKNIKVAILGDSATQFLTQAIRAIGWEKQLDLEIFEADFDQIDRQVLGANSDLYKFRPEIIIIFECYQKTTELFYNLNDKQRKSFAYNSKTKIKNSYKIINSRLGAKLVYFNFPQMNDGVFGNFASKIETSLPYQIKKLNSLLNKLSTTCGDLFILDLASLVQKLGTKIAIDQKFWSNSSLALSIDMHPIVAKNVVDIICAANGDVIKCVIVDLDNTLWGGIIGDDGLDGIQIGELGIGKSFSQFQLWLRELRRRGIILAVASKNNERVAKDAFKNHPDMILSLSDFAIFAANWNSKIDNIDNIQKTLNLSFSSMVFLDDNPLEREIIKKTFPLITVPDLPQDATEWLTYLQEENLFETASFSVEDKKRTRHLRQNAKRALRYESFADETLFLKNLKMVAKIGPFNTFDIPRVAQLSQRSNQFNLRTVRYSEEQIKRISQSKKHLTVAVQLKDKFGDLGLISAIILEKTSDTLFVDTWIMSCRVLKRGVEDLVMNHILSLAKGLGTKTIVGEYIPTEKNGLVKKHFPNLGFTKKKGLWQLPVSKCEKRDVYIRTN